MNNIFSTPIISTLIALAVLASNGCSYTTPRPLEFHDLLELRVDTFENFMPLGMYAPAKSGTIADKFLHLQNKIMTVTKGGYLPIFLSPEVAVQKIDPVYGHHVLVAPVYDISVKELIMYTSNLLGVHCEISEIGVIITEKKLGARQDISTY